MRELYVDNETALEDYLATIESIRSFAIDTEFVREKTYYPQLCLVQIAGAESIACIDCLAPLDLRRLLDRLLVDGCEWIVHSSRQDLEVIYQHAQALPHRLIDTQVAAGLIGFPPQIGLQDLLSKLLGVELSKEYTRTDWSRRPLPAAALAYARDDVRSLHALWAAIAARLEALGRLDWLEQDCSLLISQAPIASTEQIWLRLRGLRGLDVERQSAALALVEWREQRAQSRDRPRRWILGDEQLLAIARALPNSADDLRSIAELPSRLVERASQEILTAVAAGKAPEARARATDLTNEQRHDKDTLRELQAAVKRTAESLGLYPEIIATKQDLIDVSLGRPPARITTTWRADVLRGLLGREP